MSKEIELDFKSFVEHSDLLSSAIALSQTILPSVQKTATIKFVERNKNPIFVLLSDGTKLYFSWDEFRRIKGPEPSPGKKMTVTFQRNEMDRSKEPSKINNILVH